jgi:hypothetical protein
VGIGHDPFSSVPLILANFIAIAAMMALVLLASFLLKLPKAFTAMLLITSFYGNIIYMGYPVVQLAFGNEAVPIVVVVATVYNLIIFSAGLALLQYFTTGLKVSEIPKHLLMNPLLVSSAAGLAFGYFGIAIPTFLGDSLSLLGHVTAPLALFSMGIFLYGRNPLAGLRTNLAIAALKLVAFPFILIASAGMVGLVNIGLKVSLVEAAMPLAVTNFILATQYKLDSETVANAIVLTTILSPLALAFFGQL